MDSRLRAAVDSSIGWYEDLCALHGVGSTLTEGLWSSVETPPPLHSDAVVVEPGVTVGHVESRLRARAHAGVKDSFDTLDLSRLGMTVLFAASWISSAAVAARPPESTGWTILADEAQLAHWTARHDTTGVLLPGLLQRAHFRILARYDGPHITAGAVARLGSGVVEVSNVWAATAAVDWADLAAAVGWCFPNRPMVGYERGDALTAASEAGFEAVGRLRVWVR